MRSDSLHIKTKPVPMRSSAASIANTVNARRCDEPIFCLFFSDSAPLTVYADMAGRHPILAILGPTASGKSALADAIARRAGAEILSVDSMQVYRSMDIGTAKPTPAERAAVTCHLLDLAEPDELFTVARFVELADQVITNAQKPLIATGGTPLYYKALFEGLFDGPPADNAVREKLGLIPNQQLHARLALVDPPAAARIHMNDSRRMIRALEVFELTGKPITSFQTDWDAPVSRHPTIFFGLLWEKDAINRRINARVKAMIAAGWVEETRQLLDRYGELSMTAAEATGYRELTAHVRGQMTLENAIEQIKISTRQLARKQMKWFKRFANVRWLPGEKPVAENAEQILRHWPRAQEMRKSEA
jgi:tRNA dimethylallyltransferase